MEYLQQHGYDKAVQALQAELQQAGGEKDGDGETEERPDANATLEAVFRAPGAIPLETMVKRNIPQATTVSVSTMSDRITPEFIAQSKYIIEKLQARLEEQADAETEGRAPGLSQASFIDPSDRVEGYKRYRRWVSDGLDMWKVSLSLSPDS
jgi:transcription initiation factor TFIID subunit 5